MYGILIFRGCLNKWPQISRLKNPETYSGDQSPISRCQQGHDPSGGPRRNISSLLPGYGGSRCSLSRGCILLYLASILTSLLLWLCLSSLLSLKGHITGLKAHLGNPGWSYLRVLNLLAAAITLFPNKVTLKLLGCGYIFLSLPFNSLLFQLPFLSE